MANWLDKLERYAKQELQRLALWELLEVPIVITITYVMAQWITFEWIGNHFAVDVPFSMYLASYFSKQITVGFVGLLFLFIAIRLAGPWIRGDHKFAEPAQDPLAVVSLLAIHTGVQPYEPAAVRKSGSRTASLLRFLCVVLMVCVPTASLILWQMPRSVSHIKIKFLDEPDFNTYALVYLLYELNRRQQDWFFNVDFEPFDERVLSREQREKCDGPDQLLCFAEIAAGDMQTIAITSRDLGDASFWQMRGKVSVISTHDWDELYSPPSVYEYLAYSVIVQSLVLHLNADHGLPAEAYQESPHSYGDILQFTPRRNALRAEIAAPNMTMNGRALLLNRFGIKYLERSENLLGLDWISSGPVAGNLDRYFDVDIDQSDEPSENSKE